MKAGYRELHDQVAGKNQNSVTQYAGKHPLRDPQPATQPFRDIHDQFEGAHMTPGSTQKKSDPDHRCPPEPPDDEGGEVQFSI